MDLQDSLPFGSHKLVMIMPVICLRKTGQMLNGKPVLLILCDIFHSLFLMPVAGITGPEDRITPILGKLRGINQGGVFGSYIPVFKGKEVLAVDHHLTLSIFYVKRDIIPVIKTLA
jgi:hypothetical protein